MQNYMKWCQHSKHKQVVNIDTSKDNIYGEGNKYSNITCKTIIQEEEKRESNNGKPCKQWKQQKWHWPK